MDKILNIQHVDSPVASHHEHFGSCIASHLHADHRFDVCQGLTNRSLRLGSDVPHGVCS